MTTLPARGRRIVLLEALKDRDMDFAAIDAFLDTDAEGSFGVPFVPTASEKRFCAVDWRGADGEFLRITPLGEWYLEMKK